MTDAPPKSKSSGEPERIAKAMARAGVASRRDAERMILAGRVAVNGTVVTSPALDVLPSDKVTLDGKPIDAPQATRLWLYYKPLGLVTSEKDEKGRQTVFESLPDGMPRVMSIGRLDLNSEGLLLLTNDGGLKRQLELPETGWLRKYRVRVNGHPTDQMLKPLREGVTVTAPDGTAESFLPMDITIDRQQGANAWLTVGLREGKNREIRRAMTEIGLVVNRLIRVSYGPFRLNELKPGEVSEVKARVMREQLGGLLGEEEAPHGGRGQKARRAGASGTERPERRPRDNTERGERKPRQAKATRGSDKDARGSFGDKIAGQDGRARAPRVDREARGDGPQTTNFGKPKVDRPRSTTARGSDGTVERPRRSFGAKPDGGARPKRGVPEEGFEKRRRKPTEQGHASAGDQRAGKTFSREGAAKSRDRGDLGGKGGKPGFGKPDRNAGSGRPGTTATPNGDRATRPYKSGASKTGAPKSGSGNKGDFRGNSPKGGGKPRSGSSNPSKGGSRR